MPSDHGGHWSSASNQPPHGFDKLIQDGFQALAVVEAACRVGDPRELVEVVADPTQGSDGRRVDAAGQPVAESCSSNVGTRRQVNLSGASSNLLPLRGREADRLHEGEPRLTFPSQAHGRPAGLRGPLEHSIAVRKGGAVSG